MKKVVSLKDFARTLDVDTKAEVEQFKTAVLSGIAASIPHLVQTSPVDTGLYAQSWNFTKTEQGAILENTAPHSGVIEYGARPFTPPIQPLLQWAKRVLQDPSQPPLYSPEVWALARGTQNKIKQFGMKPRKVLESAIPTILENIKREYKR